MDRYDIAGSRVIQQSFQFAIGLSEIPGRDGGNYGCILFHKHIESNPNDAFIYRQKTDRWFEVLGRKNKFDLYKEHQAKIDGRYGSEHDSKIELYIKNQTTQHNMPTTTAELNNQFVLSDKMSTDTLHKSLHRLQDKGTITKPKTGNYVWSGLQE